MYVSNVSNNLQIERVHPPAIVPPCNNLHTDALYYHGKHAAQAGVTLM